MTEMWIIEQSQREAKAAHEETVLTLEDQLPQEEEALSVGLLCYTFSASPTL
jgi:hypothetical protein